METRRFQGSVTQNFVFYGNINYVLTYNVYLFKTFKTYVKYIGGLNV